MLLASMRVCMSVFPSAPPNSGACCTKLILSLCFRTMIFLRDLVVGCAYIFLPQQPLCCSCPFMKMLPASLLSLLLVLLSSVERFPQYWRFWHSGTCCPQAQPPHPGSDTMHQSRGTFAVKRKEITVTKTQGSTTWWVYVDGEWG